MTTYGHVGESMRTWQIQEALEDLLDYYRDPTQRKNDIAIARRLVCDHNKSAIYRALDLAASDPRFELAQQSGWLQQVRDAVTELL